MERSVYNGGMPVDLMPASVSSGVPRERILATAERLFYLEGIRATGVDRLIAASGVTKVTFYRQFVSKDELILAVLEQRHLRWMTWFSDALKRHGGQPGALVPALAEWLRSPTYRGCAFINSVGELEGVEAVRRLSHDHKLDMQQAIEALLPVSRTRSDVAAALAVAADGAMVRAQVDGRPEPALRALERIVRALTG